MHIPRTLRVYIHASCKAQQSAWKNRLDNVNHCLRAFGVDGGSTSLLEKENGRRQSGEALLRSNLVTFAMLGDGPCGYIDCAKYRRRLSWLGKRALSDDNLIEELVYANLFNPELARNGVKLWNAKGKETQALCELMVSRSGTGGKVLVIIMDPRGRALMI